MNDPIRFSFQRQALHPIDPRLFGQFLERPSWSGESGPEAYADAHGDLPPALVAALAGMRIPLVRFPFGTDGDYTDWTDLIDGAPGRAGRDRPITRGYLGGLVGTRFGWMEYARLADRLGWQTIAVVNLLDGLARRKPLAEAAGHAAGLVAWLNAPLGARLPAGLPDWPAIRAAHGRPAPLGVRYVQIGNETWMTGYIAAVRTATGLAGDALAAWYVEVLRAYVAAIRAVDPTVELIIDGEMGDGIECVVLADPVLREAVRWTAFHAYAPGSMARVQRQGVEIPPGEADAAACWRSLVAMPGCFSTDGQAQGFGRERLARARSLGYRVAVTEWNWNGWGVERLPPALAGCWRHAAGLGTAGFLHGMFRQGDDIGLATQSMLVGTNWEITALRLDADGAVIRRPQGQVAAFYAAHVGSHLLPGRLDGAPTWTPDVLVGWGGWAECPQAVAAVDALATGDDRRSVVHLVNRSQDPVTVLIEAPADVAREASVHRLVPSGGIGPEAGSWFRAWSEKTSVADGHWRVQLPPASLAAVLGKSA
jgi:alpha-N-arabinofuranosidase